MIYRLFIFVPGARHDAQRRLACAAVSGICPIVIFVLAIIIAAGLLVQRRTLD